MPLESVMLHNKYNKLRGQLFAGVCPFKEVGQLLVVLLDVSQDLLHHFLLGAPDAAPDNVPAE